MLVGSSPNVAVLWFGFRGASVCLVGWLLEPDLRGQGGRRPLPDAPAFPCLCRPPQVWCRLRLWLCRSARLRVRRGCGLYLEPCRTFRPFPQLRRQPAPLGSVPSLCSGEWAPALLPPSLSQPCSVERFQVSPRGVHALFLLLSLAGL